MKHIFLAATAVTLLACGVVSATAAHAELSPAHSHWDVHSYTNHEIQLCYDPTAIDASAGNTLSFVPLREQDAQNFMELDIQRNGFALQKRLNGTLSTISPSFSTSGLEHGVGDDIMVDFVMDGSTYTLYQLNGNLSRGAELYQWHDSTYRDGVNISYYTEPHVAGTWDFVHAFPIDGGIGEPHDIYGLHQDATNHNSVTGMTTFDDPTPADGGATDITTSGTFGLASGANYVYTITKAGSTGNGSFDFRDPGDANNELFFQNGYYRFRTGAAGGEATLQRFNGSTPGAMHTASSGGPGTYTLSLQGPDMYVKDSSGRPILHVNDGGPQSGLRVRLMPAPGESWTWFGKRGSGRRGSVSAHRTSAVPKVRASSATLHASGSCPISLCTAWLRDRTDAASMRYDSQRVAEGKTNSSFTTQETGSGGVQVASAPTGPATPSSGWHVAYADAFGGTLHNRATGSVAGDDDTWLYDGGTPGIRYGFNADEVEVFKPSQISEQSDGLHETCKYTPRVASGKNYTCGYVISTGDTTPSTGFSWMPSGGATWAFEVNAKFAPQFDGGPQNGGNDEGWWASGGPPLGSWKDEIDYFEHWGFNAVPSFTGDAWAYSTSPFHVTDIHSRLSTFCGCDPAGAFHKYTTVINPDNSWSWYMDGRLIGTHAPPPSFHKVWMKLILSYGLRVDRPNPNPIPGFKSGSRDFTIRSVAVYQDGAHAGKDVQNPGIASGTTVGPRSG